MDKIVVHGGHPLQGEVKISGAKNSALPILAGAILSSGRVELEQVPMIRDIQSMLAVLRTLGGRVMQDKISNRVSIFADTIDQVEAPYELVKTMRASILVLGPIVAKLGYARVSLPGGCAIGSRPIDIHLKGLEALGAEIKIEHGYVHATAKRLKGANYVLPFASVGATENLMMAATLADGKTVLENVAQEPEIEDLAGFLNALGSEVTGAGTNRIEIIGREKLLPGKYTVMPDRIEAGTFLVAGVITKGNVTVKPMLPRYLDSFLQKLEEAGICLDIDQTAQTIRARVEGPLRPIRVQTEVFPGFPTDLQAQLMALACIIPGVSLFDETIFENRFMHVAELNRMGGQIDVTGNEALVTGVPYLTGAEVMASDLRASAALVLAGLVARGKTSVNRVYHIDRGYERFEKKLSALGADIYRDRDTAN